MIRSVPAVLLAASLIVFSGCGRPQIASYRVPKEKESGTSTVAANPNAAPGDMAATPVATAGGPDLTWTAPAGWAVQPASAMRKGSYLIQGADGSGGGDMSITAFPGEAGGFLANVNRWRGQLSLSPLSQADAEAAVTHLDVGSLHFDIVEFANAQISPPQRVLGAITQFNGSTWFFKLSGPDSLIAGEKQAFLGLIQSVRTP